jgi:hypothetical protein
MISRAHSAVSLAQDMTRPRAIESAMTSAATEAAAAVYPSQAR